ncbi:AraC-like DNA-binding protein [Thermosporothrix hazakensis]|jgi:AraC-like DNA-binding protein|uniref:AraC-like DNA-binding protein n=2 Tax=Thermosporothrix hazakensis TaxID=644383 RepID=A0A326U754_THEHA|nr:AraC-like DNA-binding protein [Thermosporothrix hazakensis]
MCYFCIVVENLNMVYTTYLLKGLPVLDGMGYIRGDTLHPDRVLDFWVLGLITRGKMHLQIDREYALLTTGNYYLLPPHVRHRGTEPADFDVIYLHFTIQGEQLTTPPKPDQLALPVFGHVPTELNYPALYAFLKKAADFRMLSPEQLSIQVAAILSQLSIVQQYAESAADPARTLAYGVMDYLRKHFSLNTCSSDLPAALGYSYGHLARLFRKQFGISIHQHLLQLRIDAATEQLLMGRSIKETARLVGFQDYHYFLKVFKKRKGVSPGELQQRSQTLAERE